MRTDKVEDASDERRVQKRTFSELPPVFGLLFIIYYPAPKFSRSLGYNGRLK